jgi:hypothetical protein
MTMNLYRTNPRGLTYQISCCTNPANSGETTITLCKGKVTLDNIPATTDKKIKVEIPLHEVIEKWDRWKKGTPIQHVFTGFTTSQREFLISGLDDDEWNKIFGEDAKGRTRTPNNAGSI